MDIKTIDVIGTLLRVYNFISKRQKEKKIHEGQEEDWEKYVSILQQLKQNGGNVISVKIGSEDHKWAERMVEKGLLEREGEGPLQTLLYAPHPSSIKR